jgi:hypothetical protein
MVQAGLLRNPAFGLDLGFRLNNGETDEVRLSLVHDFLDLIAPPLRRDFRRAGRVPPDDCRGSAAAADCSERQLQAGNVSELDRATEAAAYQPATTVHWHGVLLPNGMDGAGGLTKKAIQPGETFKYEVTLHQSGTAMYHWHYDDMTQIALALTGLLVIHPRRPRTVVDRDFAILLHEWRVDHGTKRPNPNEMIEFNMLTMNARAFLGTAPLVVRTGQRVRRGSAQGAVARGHLCSSLSAARARSSSWQTRQETRRCTAT